MMSPMQIIWFFLLFFLLDRVCSAVFHTTQNFVSGEFKLSLLKQPKFCSSCGSQMTFEKKTGAAATYN